MLLFLTIKICLPAGIALVKQNIPQVKSSLLNMVQGIQEDQVKHFEGCPPQILLGSFLNTLTHMTPHLKM